MSQAPTPYVPDADFSTLAATPITSAGLPGTQLDSEFAEIAATLTATQARLAELQRDDGAVRNGVVGFLAMSADVLAAFASIGSNYRGQWSPGQNYVSGDLVISGIDNYPYLCGEPHTSSASFESDFSAGVWAILGYRPTTDSLVVNTFSGTGAQTAFSLTKNPVDENNTQVYVAGVYQKKSTYSIAGTSPAVLTFAVAPAAAPNNIEVVIGVSAELINNVVTIPDNSVGTAAIINLNVTTGKLADLSVTAGKLAAAAVTTAKILDLNVTTAKLADLSVTSAKIAGAAIDSTKLAANAVQTANIQAGAVANAQLMIGAVDATKLATDAVETLKIKDAAVTAAKLAADVGVLFVPAGAVMPFAMNSAPTGWLAASGTAVSRTTYATLFAAISTTYGVGDGSTTFNLPDLRGYFVRGSGTNSDATESGTFGAKQADAFEAHTHLLTLNQNSTSNGTTTAESSFNGPSTGNATTSSTGDTETRPKNIAMLYCIKH